MSIDISIITSVVPWPWSREEMKEAVAMLQTYSDDFYEGCVLADSLRDLDESILQSEYWQAREKFESEPHDTATQNEFMEDLWDNFILAFFHEAAFEAPWYFDTIEDEEESLMDDFMRDILN